jgi:hypothetical protein
MTLTKVNVNNVPGNITTNSFAGPCIANNKLCIDSSMIDMSSFGNFHLKTFRN